jgi:import inner membrane translocase subunit TIM21
MASLLVRSGVRPASRLGALSRLNAASSSSSPSGRLSNEARTMTMFSSLASSPSLPRSPASALLCGGGHFERLLSQMHPCWRVQAFAPSSSAVQTAMAASTATSTSSSYSTSSSSSSSPPPPRQQPGTSHNSGNSSGSGSGGRTGGSGSHGGANTSASSSSSGGGGGAVAARARRGSSGSSDITDQIPVRPVGVVEGASYTVVIVAGVACAAAVLYAAASELLGNPVEYSAFSAALERARDDPRVAVRLGSPVTGYGQEARGRAARQRIPHRLRTDEAGVEHVQIQFRARGPGGAARVTAEMFQRPVEVGSSKKEWAYDYMVADFEHPQSGRVTLVAPGSDVRR